MPCRQMLPVEGWWMSLSLTAKHHLSANLSRLNGKHHAAWLFGEHGPQQDPTSWVENQKNDISFDVLVSPQNHFKHFSAGKQMSKAYSGRTKGRKSAAHVKGESLYCIYPFGMDPSAMLAKPMSIFHISHKNFLNP